MKIFALISLVLLQMASLGLGEDPEKVILFTNIHSQGKASISLKNETVKTIERIKVHAACGCVAVMDWPQALQTGETGKINVVFKLPNQEQRKENRLIVEGSEMFKKEIVLVSYFFSEQPQVFGDTTIHLTELPPAVSSKTVVVIGDESMANLKTSLQQSSYIHYKLSDVEPVDSASECFERVLKIVLEPSKLLGDNQNIVRATIDNNRRLVVSIQ